MSIQVGARVGSYEIVDRLGQGGMASVYKAYHPQLDRHVAIKVLHPVYKDDSSFLRRFTREAQVVARLEHPNIVPIYDFAEHEGYPFLVMRYIEGVTLKERMSQGALQRPEIVRISSAIADALDYAHAQGVLHRDIKPSNVLLAQGGKVFIADFGLARIAQAGESTLSQDMIMGTPQYISPEQAKGIKDLDGRADLYSFGIVLYEMVTGRVPFQSDTSYSIIHSHIFDQPPRPSAINDKISPEMEAVLLKSVEKEPVDRYGTAREMAAAFEQAAMEMPTDISPAGVIPLPDYTPIERTRLAEEVPDAGATELPELPDLPAPTGEQPAGESQPKAQSRGRWLLLGAMGMLLGVFLCLLLLRGIQNRRDGKSAAAISAETRAAAGTREATAATLPSSPSAPMTDGSPADADLAKLFLQTGELRSVEELEALLAKNPEDNQLRGELALAYIQAGRQNDAHRLVRQILARTRLPLAYIAVADRLMVANRAEMALLILEEGLLKFENEARIQQMLMMVLVVGEWPEDHIRIYLEGLSDAPDSPTQITAQIGRAYLALKEGHPERAVELLSAALEVDNPFEADVLFLLGSLYASEGSDTLALEAFQKASELQPAPWLIARIDEAKRKMQTN